MDDPTRKAITRLLKFRASREEPSDIIDDGSGLTAADIDLVIAELGRFVLVERMTAR